MHKFHATRSANRKLYTWYFSLPDYQHSLPLACYSLQLKSLSMTTGNSEFSMRLHLVAESYAH
jgi:hypothetical protein